MGSLDGFAINTYSYIMSSGAADCVRRLSDRGARAVELMMYPGHLWVDDSAEIRADLGRALSDTGTRLVAINGPNVDLNIAAATREAREMSLGLIEGYIRVAGELGAEGLILGPGKANPLFPMPQSALEAHFFRALDRLVPLCESAGCRIYVENMPFAFLPGAADLMDSLARHGGDLKICYDVANGHFIGEDPAQGLATVAPRLALVHASDTTRRTYRHDAVGAGDLDFVPVLTAMRAAGYDDLLMLEIISANADADNEASAAALRALGFGAFGGA